MSEKTYKCPYCEERYTRSTLSSHVDKKHAQMIPKGYTATRVAFNSINKKEHGTCIVCKRETPWSEEKERYERLCGRKSCKDEYTAYMKNNMIKVYNKPSLLDDAEFQEKMLANRSISGTYKFRDGGEHTYTGSYEHKLLEFMDKVLDIKSTDLMCPGPTFEYEYKGETHKWITDVFYIPYNLVIEVKDGGNNHNNRSMPSYREKQVYKEKMITDMGEFSYLRLTNNNFKQLWSIFAELKMNDITGFDDKIVRIHEQSIDEWAGLAAASPVQGAGSEPAFIVQYGMRNIPDSEPEGYGLMNDMLSDRIVVPNIDGGLSSEDTDDFLEGRNFEIYQYIGDKENVINVINSIKEAKNVPSYYLYESLTGNTFYEDDQLDADADLKKIDFDHLDREKEAIVDRCLKEASALVSPVNKNIVQVNETMDELRRKL